MRPPPLTGPRTSSYDGVMIRRVWLGGQVAAERILAGPRDGRRSACARKSRGSYSRMIPGAVA